MSESNINNWTELLAQSNIYATDPTHPYKHIFSKLIVRINQAIKNYQKNNNGIEFDNNVVVKNQTETFNIFKTTYEQLFVEKDVTDIFVEIEPLSAHMPTGEESIKHTRKVHQPKFLTINMIGTNKWIKLHFGSGDRLFFFDEEKTILSDKAFADFFNKYDIVKEGYTYFGSVPEVYWKFHTMPSADIIEYFDNKGVKICLMSESTPVFEYKEQMKTKVVIDQTIMLALCSNLSYGFSDSFYQSETCCNTKEEISENKIKLDSYLEGKEILMAFSAHDQVKYKVSKMGGIQEKERFEGLSQRIRIVPDVINPRFYYLKDNERLIVSVAEQELATIVTGNQRMCNKIDTYYSEIMYEQFISGQLTEEKFM